MAGAVRPSTFRRPTGIGPSVAVLVALALGAWPAEGFAREPARVERAQVQVAPTPPTPIAVAQAPDLFPLLTVVENGGRLTATGAEIDDLSVRAPSGATVLLRCSGRGCPRTAVATTVDGIARFRSFHRRLLAGTVLELWITRPGSVGKYTRLAVRRGEEPARDDGCLAPDTRSPQVCPSPVPPPAQATSQATAEGLNAQGYLLIRRRRYAEAVPQFVTAASQTTLDDQTYASSLFGLARSLRRLGRAQDALTVIRRRVELPPSTTDARRELRLAKLSARRARGSSALDA